MPRRVRRLPGLFWYLFAATLVNSAGSMVLPFITLYLTRSLGLSPPIAASAIAVYGLGAISSSAYLGRASDRLGRIPVLVASLGTSGVVLLLLPLARGGLIVAGIFALAVFAEAFKPAGLALVADLIAEPDRAPAFGLYRMAMNLGLAVGPALGGVLAARSFGWLFVVDGVTSLAAALILLIAGLRARISVGAATAEAPPPPEAGRFSGMADPRMRRLLLVVMPVLFVYFQHLSAMQLFMIDDLGLKASDYGLVFTLNTVLVVMFQIPLNEAVRRWPYRRAMSGGAVLFAIGFGGMALAGGRLAVFACVVVWTAGEMILFPAMAGYVAALAPFARRGEYMGLYVTAVNLALAAGPALGASVLARCGGGVLWTATFVLGLVSAAASTTVRDVASPGHPTAT